MDNNTAPGIYPASLKITYSDDLKNTHELIVNNTFTVKPQRQQQSGDQGQNFFGFGGALVPEEEVLASLEFRLLLF